MATQFIFGRPLHKPRSIAKDKRAERENPDPVISPMQGGHYAEYQRTAKAGDMVRNIVRNEFRFQMDSLTTGRLSRRLLMVIRADKTNCLGARNLVDGPIDLLEEFDFNAENALEHWLDEKIELKITPEQVKAYVQFVPRVPLGMEGLTIPGYFRLYLGLVQVNFLTGKHCTIAYYSDYKSYLKTEKHHFLSALMPSGVRSTQLIFAGIEFFNKEEKGMLPYQSGKHHVLSIIKANGP